MDDLVQLPADLPRPVDDGACDHLPGAALPALALPATDGTRVSPAELPGTTVLYVYPMTGRPGAALPPGWDGIPGARGCTPQACAFRDHHQELAALGARVYGVSAQSSAAQREARVRLHLPFQLLSDAGLPLAAALGLPTFAAGGETCLKRVTLIARDGRVCKVFYPVFPPDRNADEVIHWLRAQGR